MEGTQSSTTAEYMALFRAQELGCRKAGGYSTIRLLCHFYRPVFALLAPCFVSPS